MSKGFSPKKRTRKDLLGFLVIPVFVALSGLEANPRELTYNLTAMYIALGCSAILVLEAVLAVIFNIHNWWLTYLAVAAFYPLATGIMAFNWATDGMRNWMIGVPLIVAYILAVLMPFINEKLAKRLHDELFAPTTPFGRLIVFSTLAIGPIAGSFGVFMSGVFKRSDGLNGYMVFGLFYCLFLCWSVVDAVYQVWWRRPWKDKE